MSLVGPRPERPELQKEIEKEVPEFGLRLQAMVSGCNLSFDAPRSKENRDFFR